MAFKAEFGHACDVHRIVHEDASPKLSARFCSLCGHYICNECRVSWDRVEAAGVTLGQKFLRLIGKAA